MFAQLAAVLSLVAALAAPRHPHNPKVVKLQGAAGAVTVLYFTVEFNPARLTALEPGFDWHLGYAELQTEVDLACGDTRIGKGAYKLNARRGASAEDWTAVLVPASLWKARNAVRQAARLGEDKQQEAKAALAAAEADLKARGAPTETVLPLAKVDAGKSEHLELFGVHYGFDAVARGSEQPAGGMQCGVRIGFGDLHRELKLSENFKAAGK